jgi:hypothetical protein
MKSHFILNQTAARRRSGLKISILFLLLIISISLASLSGSMRAQEEPAPGNESTDNVQVARLSLADHVSVQRGDDPSQTFAGAINTPLQTGDRVFTDAQGRSELQFGGNFIRLGANGGLEVIEFSSDRSQFRLPAGTATINLRYTSKQPVEIDTPNAAITLLDTGEYRINVASDTQSEVLVLRGRAEVFDGDSTSQVASGRIGSLGEGPLAINDLPQGDDWDRWNQQRDDELTRSGQSHQYVSDDDSVAGTEDLDRDGQWIDTPEYGRVWAPNGVSSDWAPYREGQWIWRDPFGWTWISVEPWGWAPYHYGRWAFISTRWCWVPGGGHRYYSPAIVGFITYPDGSIGWVPIAPRETYYGWWDSRRGGYGPSIYYNQRYRNSITLTTRDGFVVGRVDHRAIIARGVFDFRIGRAVAVLGVVPTRASLVPHFGGRSVLYRPAPRYFERRTVVRNTHVLVVRPFSEKVIDIRKGGGAPVGEFRTNTSGHVERREIESRSRDRRGTLNSNSNGGTNSNYNRGSSDSNTNRGTSGSNTNRGTNSNYNRGSSGSNTNRGTSGSNTNRGTNSNYNRGSSGSNTNRNTSGSNTNRGTNSNYNRGSSGSNTNRNTSGSNTNRGTSGSNTNRGTNSNHNRGSSGSNTNHGSSGSNTNHGSSGSNTNHGSSGSSNGGHKNSTPRSKPTPKPTPPQAP